MIIKENNENNTLKIWVDNEEKDTYMSADEYKEAISYYKNTHKICVLVGGTLPMVPTISSLLDAQNTENITS